MNENTRRRACAAALVVAPALSLAGHLVQLTPTAHDTSSELASLAVAPGRAELSAGIGFLALLLAIPAFLGMAGPLWASRPRLALVGVSMSVAGVLGLTALMGSSPLMVALARSTGDHGVLVEIADAYESSALVTVWVLLMLVGYSLGPIVLGVGLWRSGWPWLVPAALVLGVALMIADAGRWPLAAAFVATWLGLATAGVRLWDEAGERDPAGAADERVDAFTD